jgi:uncharacterized protein (DUF1800 family)
MVTRGIVSVLVLATLALGTAAQDDPDPNSPTPVLLSHYNSTRALAIPAEELGKTDIKRAEPQAFDPNETVTLFITNVTLLKDEGYNAFRVYAFDRLGRQYRFPTIALQRIPEARNVYALTMQMRDEIGYFPAPTADGDLAIYVAWRGLASNSVQIGYGRMGGGIGELPGARPTPLGTVAAPTTARARRQAAESDAVVGYRWSQDRARFLEQATFGTTPALDSRIRRIGLRTWLAEQFEMPYPSNPYPDDRLRTTNIGSDPLCDNNNTTTAPDDPPTCFRDTYSMYRPQRWFFEEALYGNPQLRHRVAWALHQVLVTSGTDVQQGRHMVEYHKILSRNAFGNYKNILREVTLNPAMGVYLDMAISTRNSPNENYARELMQLFSIGLFMLNQDGTLQLDQQGNPIPTYDQNGVNNLTKVLTGWNLCQIQAQCPNLPVGVQNFIDPMIITNTNNHDITAKTLLNYPGATNVNIPACTGCNAAAIQTYAANSMTAALNNIYYHPNVAPFISKLLIQHLVTSDPTPAYVARVAAVFTANRDSDYQMKEVIKAILLDPEARGDVKTDPNYGKLLEPVQYSTRLLRAMNVRGVTAGTLSDGVIFQRGEFLNMGQLPFRSPTVFNFYPPDYVVPGLTILGPEFALMTTGTSIQRTNFVNRFVFTPAAVPVSADAPNGTSLDLTEWQSLAAADTSGQLLVDELNRRLLHGKMSPAMRSNILTAVTAITATDTLNRARQAIYLVATSTQYQVQR